MRTAPAYIQSALRTHDPDLSVEWDAERCCWFICWKKTQQFAYRHRDNVLAHELVESELMDIVRETDTRTHFCDTLQKMDRRRRLRLDQRDAEQRNELDSCGAEALKVIDHKRRGGAKPFVHIRSTPHALA